MDHDKTGQIVFEKFKNQRIETECKTEIKTILAAGWLAGKIMARLIIEIINGAESYPEGYCEALSRVVLV